MVKELPNQMSIPIREEKLEVKKKWVHTGEINWHKEVIVEEKNIIVPVKREELIIETRLIDEKSPDKSIRIETIRVPIREERVEIIKHAFNLENVKIYKHQLQEEESAKVVLKKEVVLIKNADKSAIHM
jgi:uncharacterized protein (TIGR02271 family)